MPQRGGRRRPRISSHGRSGNRLDTNDQCHGFTGGVTLNGGGTGRLCQPRVALILWDNFFVSNSAAVTQANKLITDLVGGPFMNGLTQYGISRGSLIQTTVVAADSNNPAPVTWDTFGTSDRDQLLVWLRDETLTLQPDGSFIYFLLLPTTTKLTNGQKPDGTPNPNVGGWHSSDGNLYWGLARTDFADLTSAAGFVRSVANIVGHELIEALTDLDGGTGYRASNGCEIGDICEDKSLVSYRGWNVQKYWSGWDAACIHGDQPVSLRKFLANSGLGAGPSLRARPFRRIGLDTIARFQCLLIT
jgi:hypothetical protein